MSSLINKAKGAVEAALDKTKSNNQHQADNPASGNYGPHGTAGANKVDPRVDSDRDHRNDPTSRVGGYGSTQATDQYGTAHGAGGIASSGTYGSNTNNPGYDNVQSGNAGPHSSNLLNKVDPRVDSDRDHRNDPTSRVGGVGNTQTYGDNYGQAGGAGGLGTTDTTYGHTGTTGLTGSHGSAPIHDATTGHTGHHSHGTHTGHTGGLAAASTTGTTGMGGGNTYDNPRSTNEGPHSSNLLNKLDPRTDSDRDHRNDPTSRIGGYGTQGDNYGHTTGTHGGMAMTGNTGAYGSGAPGAGYGDSTGMTGGYDNNSHLPGSGNASNTAGPHSSNIANKLDPRVDSNLDGSKTYGGNQTYR